MVVRLGDRELRLFADPLDDLARQSRPLRSAQSQPPFHRAAARPPGEATARSRSTPCSSADGVAAEFLAEGDRGGVHEVRPSGFDDLRELLGLSSAAPGRARRAQEGDRCRSRAQPPGGSPRESCRSKTATHSPRRSGSPCVRGVRRRDGQAPRSCSCSSRFRSRSGTRRSGTARDSRRRRLLGRVTDRGGDSSVDHAQSPRSPLHTCLLISASASRIAGSTGRPRNREVVDRPLCLCSPQGARRDPHLAHRIVLDPELVCIGLDIRPCARSFPRWTEVVFGPTSSKSA